MEEIIGQSFYGERPLYGSQGISVKKCIFGEGESPLKECKNLLIDECTFQWKYPLWHCEDVTVNDTTWEEMARAGVWYSDNLSVSNSKIIAPKNFRRCRSISLTDVEFTDAQETLWSCQGVKLNNVKAENGDYFAMNSTDMEIDNLTLDGNYSFDGGKNIIIKNSKLISKDAFWNSDNVTVYDSYISGEYLGWNSRNLTLINCTIESLQGMCYIDNLTLKNCKLINTNLAFEKSTVDVQIVGGVDSVFNPISGVIEADEIDELIIEKDLVDSTRINIVCAKINKRSDLPEWKR